jgi:hypothetical protein
VHGNGAKRMDFRVADLLLRKRRFRGGMAAGAD